MSYALLCGPQVLCGCQKRTNASNSYRSALCPCEYIRVPLRDWYKYTHPIMLQLLRVRATPAGERWLLQPLVRGVAKLLLCVPT